LVDPASGADDGEQSALADFGGFYPNVFRAIANHPGIADGFAAMAKVLYFEGSVTPAQRELAYLTASYTNSCHY